MQAQFYTIPSDFDFLDVLAKRILTETSADPLKLRDYTVVLPDTRSCEILKEKLSSLNDGVAMILPRMTTLNNIDDDVLSLRLSNDPNLSAELLKIPPAISNLDRRLYLAREILKSPETADSVSTAMGLAQDLGRFIDDLQQANVPLTKLADIQPRDFPGDLKKTQDILKIVTETWPKIKENLNVCDRFERQAQVLDVLATHFESTPRETPLILAGFHRTTHHQAQFFKTIAQKQTSNVRFVFPGLDTRMGQSWQMVGPSHPQYAFRKLLKEIEVDRSAVSYWPGTTPSTHSQRAKERLKLLRETMRPSNTTHKWKHLSVFDKSKLRPSKKVVPVGSPLAKKVTPTDREIDPIAMTGMDLIVAGTQQEEASVIALKFREMLEKPEATGVLITPDADLMERVSARLQYWDIKAGPEKGERLLETKLGQFLVHSADMAQSNLAPLSVLECLKSPYAGLGLTVEEVQEHLVMLEDLALRGARPWPGFEGMKTSLKASFNRVSGRLRDEEKKKDFAESYTALTAFWADIQSRLEADQKILSSAKPRPFKEMILAHIRLVESMAETKTTTGADVLWSGTEGAAAHKLLTALLEASDVIPALTGKDYVQFIHAMVRETTCRTQTHPRIKFLKPSEAHLSRADLHIVAGLTNSNWPGQNKERFWLSQSLREKLGLPPIESGIGHAAFDFVHGVSNKNIIMTRAERGQNAPNVSSPFLTRLEMLLKGLGIDSHLKPKSQILDLNAALHLPSSVKPIAPPQPTPPADARPRRLSVSAIETLLRDPYAVYARYVLKLYPKAPIDAPPSYAERGNIIHDALDIFKTRYPDELPEDALEKLIKIGEDAFAERIDNPSVQAFWWPRFTRMAEWFVQYEQARAEFAKTLKTEVSGRLNLETDEGRFVLTAIADRIDGLMDDSLSIIDYKTGGVPSKKDVDAGLSPQMTLEALIALSGGFDGIDAKKVGMAEYWQLSGGRPAGKIRRIDNIEQLQGEALEGLTKLLEHFAKAKTPYLPTPRPDVAPRYVPYKHLGRADEWGRNASNGRKGGRK